MTFSYTVSDGSADGRRQRHARHHAGQRRAGDHAGDAGGDRRGQRRAADHPGRSCWPTPPTSTAPALTATNLAIATGSGTLVATATAPGATPRRSTTTPGELQLHGHRRQPDGRRQRHARHHAGQRRAGRRPETLSLSPATTAVTIAPVHCWRTIPTSTAVLDDHRRQRRRRNYRPDLEHRTARSASRSGSTAGATAGSFKYTVSDGAGGTSTATVTIEVSASRYGQYRRTRSISAQRTLPGVLHRWPWGRRRLDGRRSRRCLHRRDRQWGRHLIGSGGNDLLVGGDGNDSLVGGGATTSCAEASATTTRWTAVTAAKTCSTSPTARQACQDDGAHAHAKFHFYHAGKCDRGARQWR